MNSNILAPLGFPLPTQGVLGAFSVALHQAEGAFPSEIRCTTDAILPVFARGVAALQARCACCQERNQLHKRKPIDSEGVANNPDPSLQILNQIFALLEGLDNARRGR